MRPRIEAEREMALHAAVLAAGARQMDDSDRQAYLAGLERTRDAEVEQPKVKATPAFLAEMEAMAERISEGR